MFDIFVKKLDILKWFGFKGKPQAVRNRTGWSVTRGPHGETVTCDMLTCVHCNHSWEVVVGSGRLRGFCNRCDGPTCGGPHCWVCVPYEQQLENMEASKPVLTQKPTPFALGGVPEERSPGGVILGR